QRSAEAPTSTSDHGAAPPSFPPALRRVVVAGALVTGLFVAGCGGSSLTTRPTTKFVDPEICEADRRVVRTAAEAFFAQTNRYPANDAALVAARYLEAESDYYDVRVVNGELRVVAQTGGGCESAG
ncbi:MAG: hypothetical protein ACKOYM_09315, partial [Actinomycetes bacterium]